MTAVDKYGVVGNPIAHSRSPEIHQRFAQQTRQKLTYERIEIPLEVSDRALSCRMSRSPSSSMPPLADDLTARARLAGAVNTLKFDEDTILGDNTDGIGFVRDVRERLKFDLSDCSVLVLGAGGAVRGLLGSLLDESPRWLAVANRSHTRAEELAEEFGVEAIHFDEVPAEHFDLIINGTTTGLNHEAPAIDPETFHDCALAYDLVYAAEPTPFMQLRAERRCRQVVVGSEC
jgi:shikimate dehydrogenase